MPEVKEVKQIRHTAEVAFTSKEITKILLEYLHNSKYSAIPAGVNLEESYFTFDEDDDEEGVLHLQYIDHGKDMIGDS